jgi:hypothetical protein
MLKEHIHLLLVYMPMQKVVKQLLLAGIHTQRDAGQLLVKIQLMLKELEQLPRVIILMQKVIQHRLLEINHMLKANAQ